MGEAGCLASDHGYSPRLSWPGRRPSTRRQGKIAVPLRVLRNGAVDFAARKDMQMVRAQKRALRALM